MVSFLFLLLTSFNFYFFEGHGGAAVSKYVQLNAYGHFTNLLQSSSSQNKEHTNSEISKILTQSLLNVDEAVSKISNYKTQGTTACVVYFNQYHSNSKSSSDSNSDSDSDSNSSNSNSKEIETSIITANVGDSRAVLSRNKVAMNLSDDHKPNSPEEKLRIESLGGYIKWDGDVYKNGEPNLATGVYRVNGNLALSRSLGNLEPPHRSNSFPF